MAVVRCLGSIIILSGYLLKNCLCYRALPKKTGRLYGVFDHRVLLIEDLTAGEYSIATWLPILDRATPNIRPGSERRSKPQALVEIMRVELPYTGGRNAATRKIQRAGHEATRLDSSWHLSDYRSH